MNLDVTLQKATRSRSEQLNATQKPSVPPNDFVLRSKSPRRQINSASIAELRRRRRNQLDSPRKTAIVEGETAVLSPRTQIMCVGNYDLGKTIGRGQFGKVKQATHVLTGEIVSLIKKSTERKIIIFKKNF